MSEPTKEITVPNPSQLANEKDIERIRLIQRTVAAGTTKDELMMFLYQANKTGLDPLARQIFIIVRGKDDKRKATIQASIDGLRLVAERSGKYAGQDEPEFEYATPGDKIPTVCRLRVYKFSPNGQRYQAAVGMAHWNEYKPATGSDFMWLSKPHVMLAKVAEALALRKAFPQDLSGIYASEEMEQVKEAQINTPIEPPPTLPAKTDDEKVLSGETVDQLAGTEPKPERDEMILGYEKKIMAIQSDTGLKIIESEITTKGLTEQQKMIILDMINARRQDLADKALGK